MVGSTSHGARVQEGDMRGAEEMLDKAMVLQKALPPGNPHRAKVHYFYALVQKAYGKYDDALEHLRIAALQFSARPAGSE